MVSQSPHEKRRAIQLRLGLAHNGRRLPISVVVCGEPRDLWRVSAPFCCIMRISKTLVEMKKLTILFLITFLPLMASADIININDIYYDLDFSTKTAEVTSNPNKYTGNVDIPASVTFKGAEYRVTFISGAAFSDCNGLISVTIPNSVTAIGGETFRYCSGLTSVTIPNSVTAIGGLAFDGCSGLTSISIPSSVTSIGYGAFSNCSGLTSVHITDLESWCKISFSHYYSNPLSYANHLYINEQEIKDLVIPNSVTSIGNYAFYGYSSLVSLTIPNTVRYIGESAFDGCSGLTSITIPNSVTSIGRSSFSSCSGLTSVTIPNIAMP